MLELLWGALGSTEVDVLEARPLQSISRKSPDHSGQSLVEVNRRVPSLILVVPERR